MTGASSGLGRRAALTLARADAKVVGVARRRDALDGLCAEIGDACIGVDADVADRETLDATVARISEPFGAPDILINAAGLNTREAADDVTDQGWDATLAINLSAPFFLAQKLVPAMQERAWGRIVNFASLQSFRAFPGDRLWRNQGCRDADDTRNGRGMVGAGYYGECNRPGIFPN